MKYYKNLGRSRYIWTISLWDLKQPKVLLWFRHEQFELFPYGIWNPKRVYLPLSQQHLNYFPMGFETNETGEDGTVSEVIWTISLWDLKPQIWPHLKRCGKIWTISLWDLKQLFKFAMTFVSMIWTISLWDLKLYGFLVCF